MEKRVLIAVGGTGGHVFPALTLAKQLTQANPKLNILFVGGGLGKNRYFEKNAFPFKEIDCGTLSPRKPIKSLKNIWKIIRGITQSHSLIRNFSPDLVIGFGSYHTLPTLLATKLHQIPFILHEANRIPGKVNRLLSKYATLTGVHFPDTAFRLKGKIQTIPLPLREGFQRGSITKAAARAHFKLNPATLTILIFGGSQGAQSMNHIVSEAILQVCDSIPLQVIHCTGDPITASQFKDKYSPKISACVKEFESRMDLAWQAADLVISRAGASTLAESLEFEVPGIFIPYPHATDNHQESNADFMADVIGGGVKCLEKNLTATHLANEVNALLSDDQHVLNAMKQAMSDYKCATPPRTLCKVVMDLLQKK